MTITLQNLALDRWVEAPSGFVDIPSAVDGKTVARASSAGLDFAAMVKHARDVGGPALRSLTFHQRADRLKAIAAYVSERKEQLYKLAGDTGASRRDNAVDIEGGLGTLSAYASRGRRELPATRFIVEGEVEGLSKGGTFVGQHILVAFRRDASVAPERAERERGTDARILGLFGSLLRNPAMFFIWFADPVLGRLHCRHLSRRQRLIHIFAHTQTAPPDSLSFREQMRT